MPFLGQSPAAVITGNGILDGTVTAADLHTTLDLSTKTITYPSNSVTAAALHTTAVTDKLGYTPLQSSDLTGYATESYVTTAVSNLVDSAPGALDTLNELAAALNDDANFSTTITNSLALKAPLASPSFTGNVGIGTSSPATELDISSGAITGGTKRYVTLTSLNSSSSEIGYADIGATFNQNAAGIESGGLNFRCYHDGTVRDRYIIGAGAGDGHIWYTGDSTERMRINGSGNVGIGTSSPTQKVEISYNGNTSTWLKVINTDAGAGAASGILFANDAGSGGAISLLSGVADGSLFLRSLSTNALKLGTNNTERMRINGSGNVGIGTSSPNSKTEIVNTNAGGEAELLQIRNNATDASTTSVLRFINSTDSSSYGNGGFIKLIRNAPSDNNLTFGTVDTERMRIDSSGYVGIGTSAPAGALEIIESGAAIVCASTFKSTNTAKSARYFSRSYANNFFTGLYMQSPSAAGNNLFVGGGTGTGEPATTIFFHTGTPGSVGAGTERMRIASNGNVGIGTNLSYSKVSLFEGSVSQDYAGAQTLPNSTVTILNGNSRADLSFVSKREDSTSTQNVARIEAECSGGWNSKLHFYTANSWGDSANHAMSIYGTNLQFNSGYGSVATAYGCRAWVNFGDNGTTLTVRGGGNISSVTDNGTGDYTVNFSTAMPDSNYAVTVGYDTSLNNNTRSSHTFDMYNFLTTSVRVLTSNINLTAQDFNYVFLAIHR